MRNLLNLLVVVTLLAVPATIVCAATVCNAGFPGENSAQILQRLPQALADCANPAEVVVFVGMNDAVNEKRFLREDQTEEAVAQMLRLIAAAHAKALIVTVHYPDDTRLMQRHSLESFGGFTSAQRIDETNLALRKAARSGGAGIVDFHSALARAGGASARLSTDGVHLTRAGYGILANLVAEALSGNVADGKVLCLGDSLTYGIGVRAAGSRDTGSDSYPQQLARKLSGFL